ncbi:MAG: GrpB family protein [Gaiellaceae bacterium]
MPDPNDVAAYDALLAKVTIGAEAPRGQDRDQRLRHRVARAVRAREARIRSVLGDRVVRIEHTGSTSVPGLPAKPIDISLEVPDTTDEPAYVPDLEVAGYPLSIREPEWYEHRLFKGLDTNVNLHVFSAGCDEVDRMVLFREHLRTNAADREQYTTAKRALAARDWKYVQQYADAKSDVVREVVARAEAASAAEEGRSRR